MRKSAVFPRQEREVRAFIIVGAKTASADVQLALISFPPGLVSLLHLSIRKLVVPVLNAVLHALLIEVCNIDLFPELDPLHVLLLLVVVLLGQLSAELIQEVHF